MNEILILGSDLWILLHAVLILQCRACRLQSSPVLLESVSVLAVGAPGGDGEEVGTGGGLSLSCGRVLEVSMPFTLLAWRFPL